MNKLLPSSMFCCWVVVLLVVVLLTSSHHHQVVAVDDKFDSSLERRPDDVDTTATSKTTVDTTNNNIMNNINNDIASVIQQEDFLAVASDLELKVVEEKNNKEETFLNQMMLEKGEQNDNVATNNEVVWQNDEQYYDDNNRLLLFSNKKKKSDDGSKKNHSTIPPDGKNHTTPPDDNGKNHTKHKDACHAFDTCEDCAKTYTCHWCNSDSSCHAKGSIHGCAWGSSCKKPKPKPTPPKPKENSTCAAHTTCSQCTLSSHYCHWCAHDNACHAVGSRFGCVTGVDCYSNDRCIRKIPEKLYPADTKWINSIFITEMPISVMIGVAIFGLVLCFCTTFCFSFAGGVKGAYDDLATITMAASVAPMSVIGGPTFQGITHSSGQFHHTELETHDEEEDVVDEEEGETNGPSAANDEGGEEEVVRIQANGGVAATRSKKEKKASTTNGDEVQATAAAATDENDNIQLTTHQQRHQAAHDDAVDRYHHHGNNDGGQLTEPLLPSTQSHGGYFRTVAAAGGGGTVFEDIQEPRHMKRLYRMCGCCYFLSIIGILGLMFVSIYFYPSMPIHNVCNDAVAWKQIMASLMTFKLEGGVEILLSISNPNRLQVVVEQGNGVFRCDNEQVGSFEIPSPVTIGSMAITDLMVIATVKPESKSQAIAIAEAYYHGKLVLDADIRVTIRAPVLYDYTYHLEQNDVKINVNELSDRSLCHCPSWDDHNKTTSFITDNLWFLNNNGN